jgi:hypothetical protein
MCQCAVSLCCRSGQVCITDCILILFWSHVMLTIAFKDSLTHIQHFKIFFVIFSPAPHVLRCLWVCRIDSFILLSE